MTDFTTLVNRGHELYIAKYIKKRNFGQCANCDVYTLLLEYSDPKEKNMIWMLCEKCFIELLRIWK